MEISNLEAVANPFGLGIAVTWTVVVAKQMEKSGWVQGVFLG